MEQGVQTIQENIIFDSLIHFLNSNIHIEHDLLGACYSVNSKTSINCILGTGPLHVFIMERI